MALSSIFTMTPDIIRQAFFGICLTTGSLKKPVVLQKM